MSQPADGYVRPQTPQAMIHRLPDQTDSSVEEGAQPSKFIILIMGSTGVAGKVQIATSVSKALSCPLYQGDSLHESCAKAATVGATESGANETRYRRMWLSKMTRTGLLFPQESRPANEGFSGFGGSSASTSRRGSVSSVASVSSDVGASVSGSSVRSDLMMSGPSPLTTQYVNKPMPFVTMSEHERLRRANPALMVLTHPGLQSWCKLCIRKAVGEYGIGVIFVPLYDDDDLPILRPLDPSTMTSFASFESMRDARKGVKASLEKTMILRVDVEAGVDDIADEIVEGMENIMGVQAA